jgi:capsular polysaccharide transport system permease protein
MGMSGALSTARSPWDIQRSVLYALFLREVKTRFGGRWLGVYWALLDPLSQVLVLSVLLGTLHRAANPGIDPPVFLITGIVPFYLFRSVSTRLMDGVDANRALFGYRQVHPIDTLLSRALLEGGLYVAVSLVMFIGYGFFGLLWYPARPLELLALGTVLSAGAFGLGLVLAVATHPMPQSRAFVRVAFLLMYLVSGPMTPVNLVPSEWLPWLLLNPLLHVVELSRAYFIPGYRLIDGIDFGYVAACALVALAAGLALYRLRRQHLLAD